MSNIIWVLNSSRVSCVRCFRSSDGNHCIKHGDNLLKVGNNLFSYEKHTAGGNPTTPWIALFWKLSLGFSLGPGTDGHFHLIKVSQSSGFFLEIQAWQHISKMETATGMDQSLSKEGSVNTV